MPEKIKMTQGVPQESTLRPLLFIGHVNSSKSSIQNGKLIQYADDTALCMRDKAIHDLELKSYMDLNSCIPHFLNINPKETIQNLMQQKFA